MQRALWKRLAAIKDLGFTLYGGTAVALRLGHRVSVDFDFFTEKPLDKKAIYGAVPLLSGGEVLLEDADSLVMSVVPPEHSDPVKVSFFAMITFGRFGVPELTSDQVLRVASLDDLMGTKLKVILDRVEKKDYDDLATMVQAGVGVSRGLAIARKMFRLNPEQALKAMVYHKDVEGLSSEGKRVLIDAAKKVDILPEVPLLSRSLSEQVIGAEHEEEAPKPEEKSPPASSDSSTKEVKDRKPRKPRSR